MKRQPEPLPVELLISADERRPRVTVEDHAAFRATLAPAKKWDEVDAMLDEMIQVDPYAGDPPSKRKDKEISRLLNLLDSLERGNA